MSERLTYNYVPPRCGHAVMTNANLDSMDMHGAIVTALDIVLPRPNELDRCAAKTFCDRRRLPLHVGIGNGASAKASTRHLSMKRHLLRLQAEDLRDGHLVDGLELRAGPNFRSITIEPDGGVQGFHRGVSEIRKFVFCDYPVRGGDGIHGLLVAAIHGNVARSVRQFLILREQLCAVGWFYGGEVPLDLQAVTTPALQSRTYPLQLRRLCP